MTKPPEETTHAHHERPPGPHDPFGLLSAAKLLDHPLGFLEKLKHDYGDVVYFAFGRRNLFFFFHPDAIKEVLATKSRSFHKPEQQRSILGKVVGNGILLSEDELWLHQRRALLPAFAPDRLHLYADVMTEFANEMVESWSKQPEVDAFSQTMELAIRVAGKLFFGLDLQGRARHMAEEALTIFEMMMKEFGDFPQFTDHLPLKWKHDYTQVRQNLDQFITEVFEGRRASGQETNDLLSLLFRAIEQNSTEGPAAGMSEEQARFEAKTMFLAGLDTVASSLSWTIFLLCRNPEAQQKLQHEVDTVLGGRRPVFADASKLVYTAAALKEGMRLYSPSWMIVRECIEDLEIGGYFMPKGSQAFLPQWVVHRDPRFFEEPEQYRPERFLPGSPEGLNHFAFFPFGGGPRSCIGNHYSTLELVLVAAVIFQRFDVQLAPGQDNVVPDPQVSLLPRDGVRIKLNERAPVTA